MKRLTTIAAFGFILLATSISYAGNTLNSSEKNFLFNGNKKDFAVKELDKSETQGTKGKILGGLLTSNGRLLGENGTVDSLINDEGILGAGGLFSGVLGKSGL